MCLAFLDELGHSPDAFLDWHVRIDARHAKDVERLDSKIFQALLAGLTQITRIASAAHGVCAAVAWATGLSLEAKTNATTLGEDQRSRTGAVSKARVCGG